jgi:hypothetical protein
MVVQMLVVLVLEIQLEQAKSLNLRKYTEDLKLLPLAPKKLVNVPIGL